MCLAVPGKVVRWLDRDPIAATAEVEFGTARRVCQMACVPGAKAGDYVVVHAGVALSVMDTEQADRLLEDLSRGFRQGVTAERAEATRAIDSKSSDSK